MLDILENQTSNSKSSASLSKMLISITSGCLHILVKRGRAPISSMVRIAGRLGQEMDVLVCGVEEDGQLFGRAMCQAPDVDGVTYVHDCQVGEIVRVVIDDVLLYEMEGSIVR